MDTSTEFNDTSFNETSISYEDHGDEEDFEFDEEELRKLTQPPPDSFQLRNDRCIGFDNNTGDSWIYPTNYPIRNYQYSIVSEALFKNTLVVLPTGLGKTFIAAVIMYNIYRWYPTGKVIFMAPTRPLVNQQIDACYKVMGISKKDTVELTGKQQKKGRAELWENKRVFYCTPQVVEKDLNDPEQRFPIKDVKLVVIDEAHKAKGRYAYVEVIKAISSRNPHFRVLALTASPGNKPEELLAIIRNLMISNIEVRSENAPDVAAFVHKKNIQSVTVPLGNRLSKVLDRFHEIVDPYLRKLCEYGMVRGNTANMTKGWLFKLQENYRAQVQKHPNHSDVMYNFHVARSLYHALELLNRHGLRVFLNYFDDNTNSTCEKFFVSKDYNLKTFLQELRLEVGNDPFTVDIVPLENGEIPEIPRNLDFGHPKFIVLQKQLVDFFEKNENSKVIVFCEFRDSVALVYRLLLQNRPLIKPKCIVGQGSGSSNSSMIAISQKEQMSIMQDFRSGQCNTLVSTCVIEEGIDIGEVDLILCFDIAKDLSRFVQRIGRTGRQRKGKVLVLVTEGREKNILKDVLASKDKMPKLIANRGKEFEKFFHPSPRLVPTEFNPKCIETFIKLPETDPDDLADPGPSNKRRAKKTDEENPKKKRRKKNDEPVLGSQDVRKFFIRLPKEKNNQSLEVVQEEQSDRSFLEEDESLNAILGILDSKTNQAKNVSSDKIDEKLLDEEPPEATETLSLENLSSEEILNECCPNLVKKLLIKNDLVFLKSSLSDVEKLKKLEEIFQRDKILKIIEELEENSMKKNYLQTQRIVVHKNFLKAFNESLTKLRRLSSEKPSNEPEIDIVPPIDDEFEYDSSEPKSQTKPETESEKDEKSCSNIFEDFDGSSLWNGTVSKIGNRSKSNTPRLSISTPLNGKLKKFEFHTPLSAKESPILRGFERKVQKSLVETPLDGNEDDAELSSALEFCGLKSIEELFPSSSDEEEESSLVQSRPRKSQFMVKLESIDEMENELTMCEPTKRIDSDSAMCRVVMEAGYECIDEKLDATASIEELKHAIETSLPTKTRTSQTKQEIDQQIIQNENLIKIKQEIVEEEHSGNETASLEFNSNDLCEKNLILNNGGHNLDNFEPEIKQESSEFVSISFPQEQYNPSNGQTKQEPEVHFNSQSQDLNCAIDFGSLDDIFNISDDEDKENGPIPNSENIQENQNKFSDGERENNEGTPWRRKLDFNQFRPIEPHITLSSHNSESQSVSFATCRTNTNASQNVQDETILSIIGVKNKRQIIESSDEEEVYATCPKNEADESKSSQEMKDEIVEEPEVIEEPQPTKIKQKKRKKMRNSFLATQAEVSGDDSEDDEDDMMDLVDDSFVDNSEDNHHDETIVRAKYLESIRSPTAHRGAFKIPEPKDFKVSFADVFSQQVENFAQSNYYDDTFCVEGEDDVEYMSEVDELDRAEAILKERRRAKKLGLKPEPKRRRRIIHDDSDDSD